jgi:uncharacterized protein YjbJ (UPF0337 family)
MTHTTDHRTDPGTSSGTEPDGVAGTAREEAGHLKETAGEAAREVAGTAKEKAGDVTSDVRRQTAQLAGQTRDQLVEQAGQQKDRAADGLRSVADELRGMAEHGQSGWGAQLAGHGAQFSNQAADFLQQHEPGELLDEVRRYARKRPGTFLLGAAVLGVVAGRMTRALTADAKSSGPAGMQNVADKSTPDEYLVPPPPAFSEPPVTPASAPGDLAGTAGSMDPGVAPMDRPVPTPTAPDLDPGAPVEPRFGPGAER